MKGPVNLLRYIPLTREVLIPSCLVEVGYLSNDEEREKMTTEAYREKIAQGITDGVEQYFERFPSSQSQADDRRTAVSTTPVHHKPQN
jgi:hypothetical protein